MQNLWKHVLAYFRLDLNAVCEMSQDRGLDDDYHDYPDSTTPEPLHFHIHTCKRCGKQFTI